MKPNNVVALTVPTWAPGLRDQPERQHQVGRRAASRASATTPPDILAGTPQDALGTQRAYGCTYNTARLLYSATVVADPNQKPAKQPKKKK